MTNAFWRYDLKDAGEPVCLGERVKKGTYRGTIETCIPYSQISGALTTQFNRPFHAVGVFHEAPRVDHFSFALQDVARGVAKLTLDVAALSHIRASVFIWRDPAHLADTLPVEFDLRLGALRSKGFGLCHLQHGRELDDAEQKIQSGILQTRLPESVLGLFEVEPVRPAYGYLFEPDAQRQSGRYVRALVEGSLVRGPKFLVSERSL